MQSVKDHLQADEELKYVAKLHPIVFVKSILTILVGAALCFILNHAWMLGLAVLVGGLCMFGWQYLCVKSYIFAVTNKRVIYKKGIISRSALNIVLAKCEGVAMNQSIMGRILNYGTITVTTGEVASQFTDIAAPLTFVREVGSQIK